MYHGVHRDPSSPGVFSARYSVSPDDFAAQLDWLAGNGFTTRLLTDAPRSASDVVLTFDDGDESWMTTALPLLTERGMVAEFCVTSDYVGRPGMITTAQVRELVTAGMGVQSHARTHRPLATLSPEELAEELTTSRQRLEEWSGGTVVAVALPGGRGGAREFRAARAAGYRLVLNSVPGPNRRPRESRYLQRIVVTRGVDVADFGRLVRWQGVAPRQLAARTVALEVPKRVLGEERYGRLRQRVRSR
jgi:peptidoglycan/xylan/chitin deacetylase (PgdA/CDA1 family)